MFYFYGNTMMKTRKSNKKINKSKTKKKRTIRFSKKNQVRIIPNKEDMNKKKTKDFFSCAL